MRHFPHMAIVVLTASLACAPSAVAAPLVSSDADPLVQLDDTDLSAVDWELRANPGGTDGLSFFRSDSAAAILSLSGTNVGIDTVSPTLDFHIHAGDTPAIRLEQSGGGFTAQTWDIGANEANFFVRDLTGGSRLPFRIRPGAPTSSVDINAAGNVGIGTDSPAAALDISRVAPPSLFLTNRALNGVDWEVAAGSNLVLKTQTGSAALTLGQAGDTTAAGALQQNADAAALENRADADPAAVLDAVTKLPVGYFEYAADPANARHLAPLGADFRTALGLGGSDAAMAPADLGGVALVAIKGLAANDASFATKTAVGSIDDRLRAAEAKLGTVEGSVPSLAPVNQQFATANKQIAALQAENKKLLKRLLKLEKMTKKLARRR